MNPLLFGPIFDIIKSVLGRVLPDPEAQAKAQAQAMQMVMDGTFDQKAEQAIAMAQIDVNKADAAGASAMQRNWRPFIGWVCGVALAWDTIGRPVVTFALVTAGHVVPVMPVLADSQLYGLLFGLLGIGGLRTLEKVKGVA